MKIKYYLIDNPLTPDPLDCRAHVATHSTFTMDDVIDLAARQGTLVTKTDLKAVTEILFDIMTRVVAEGHTLVTPLCNVRPTIKGVFENSSAGFNAQLHEVTAKTGPGKLLRKKMEKAKVMKIETKANEPLIFEFLDESSDTPNSELTPGGLAIISGLRLSFNADSADEGPFFIDAAGTETKVLRIARSKPKELIFMIPASLNKGVYRFLIRSRALSKELREGFVPNLEVK